MKSPSLQRTSSGKKKILVVDDHPLTRHGVSQRITIESDLEVCAEVGNANAALAEVERCPPDLVLMDLSLGERSGLELIKDLHTLHPMLPLLVYSMHYETIYAERTLRAGARGYIMKSEGAEKLLEAIRCVLQGKVYLSAVMRDRAVCRFANGPAAAGGENAAVLSDRELEIFELIGQGLGTRQISDQLRLSISTIETHRGHIKEKLNLHGATELVRAAVEWVAKRGV